jgi:hypothetical protein
MDCFHGALATPMNQPSEKQTFRKKTCKNREKPQNQIWPAFWFKRIGMSLMINQVFYNQEWAL